MPSIKFYSPPFSAPFIRNQSSNNAGKLQSYLTAIFFCMHLSHAFCRTKAPLSILPLSSQAYKHSNHHTYAPTRRQICTCPSHLSLVCSPGIKGIIRPDVAICLSIHTFALPVNFVFLPARSPLPPSWPHSRVSQSFIPSRVFAFLTAFHPSHLSQGNAVLLPLSAPAQLAVEE